MYYLTCIVWLHPVNMYTVPPLGTPIEERKGGVKKKGVANSPFGVSMNLRVRHVLFDAV